MAKSFVGKIQALRRPLFGTVLTIPSPVIAQLAGLIDADFAMIDMEHAPMTIDIVTHMVSAYVTASSGSKFPLIRIPSHGVEWVKWALDSGAAGIVIPMVNDAAEMRAIIDKAVYPPGGRRSFGPIYAPFAHPEGSASGMAGYMERARSGDIALLPMIESKEGLQNVEEILSMPEVSGTFIGPADLRLSLGLGPAVDGDEPEFLEALAKIRTSAKKHGKVVGTMGMGQETAKKRAEEGMDFLLSTFDNGAMMAGWAKDLAAAKRGIPEATVT
ncbi:2-keto-3-deoxy-L-rhamnonate aldolase [Pseudocercospora fuligena]|uniref:2-keto-3-deoxy-L-rhamnonate aldolase n=1 Tax=Pseudocercospora fuligena TaxID=685502 RepID=A0A8H6RF74_9PEZI|nr:2-keto-3-deoxy-L-rhamnonate aldolase [Pseudocercospora fuligena]